VVRFVDSGPMRTLLALLALGLLALLPACGGKDNGGTPAVATTLTPVNPGEVVVANIAYTPATIHVAPGQQVTWRFNDNGVPHTVTSDPDSPQQFSSPQMTTGTFPVTFKSAGTYKYHCTVHARMHGTVTVS